MENLPFAPHFPPTKKVRSSAYASANDLTLSNIIKNLSSSKHHSNDDIMAPADDDLLHSRTYGRVHDPILQRETYPPYYSAARFIVLYAVLSKTFTMSRKVPSKISFSPTAPSALKILLYRQLARFARLVNKSVSMLRMLHARV